MVERKSLLWRLFLLCWMTSLVSRAGEASLVINDLDDGSPGSLRDAISSADAGETIVFESPFTIYLQSPLGIAKSLTIDGNVNGSYVTLQKEPGYPQRFISLDYPMGDGVFLKHLNFGASFVDGSGAHIEAIYSNSTPVKLDISYCNFYEGESTEGGGSLYMRGGVLSVSYSYFFSNHGNTAGAIYIDTAFSATIDHCLFESNSATLEGGAIETRAMGGAFITDSTFVDNSADNGGAITSSRHSVSVQFCTFFQNTAAATGDSILAQSDGVVTLSSNIFISSGRSNFDVLATTALFSSAGYNFMSDTTSYPWLHPGDNTSQTFDTLGLSSLADNGGPTKTISLSANSPAIDAGDPDFCINRLDSCWDQRGSPFSRGEGAAPDAGAFEFQVAPSTSTSTSTSTSPSLSPLPFLSTSALTSIAGTPSPAHTISTSSTPKATRTKTKTRTPAPDSKPAEEKSFEDDSGKTVTVDYCPDRDYPFGCNGRCVRQVSDCSHDVCDDPKDCPIRGGDDDEDLLTDTAVIPVSVVVNNDHEIKIPVSGKRGNFLGSVRVPRGAFPRGTVIRVSSFKGDLPETEVKEDKDDCKDGKQEKKQERISSVYDVEALSRKGRRKPQFKKKVTIGQVAILPKGRDPSEVCLAFNSGSGSKWVCEGKGISWKRLPGSNKDQNAWLVQKKYDHFTGFTVLLGSFGSKCGGWGVLQWLTMAFLIASGVVCLVVCVSYHIYYTRHTEKVLSNIQKKAASTL